jgi:hypothetical protein
MPFGAADVETGKVRFATDTNERTETPRKKNVKNEPYEN